MFNAGAGSYVTKRDPHDHKPAIGSILAETMKPQSPAGGKEWGRPPRAAASTIQDAHDILVS